MWISLKCLLWLKFSHNKKTHKISTHGSKGGLQYKPEWYWFFKFIYLFFLFLLSPLWQSGRVTLTRARQAWKHRQEVTRSHVTILHWRRPACLPLRTEWHYGDIEGVAVAAHAEVNTKEEVVIGSYTISITAKAGRKTKVICNCESVWKKRKSICQETTSQPQGARDVLEWDQERL